VLDSRSCWRWALETRVGAHRLGRRGRVGRQKANWGARGASGGGLSLCVASWPGHSDSHGRTMAVRAVGFCGLFRAPR